MSDVRSRANDTAQEAQCFEYCTRDPCNQDIYILANCTSKMGASGVASVVIAHIKLAKHSRYRAPAEGAEFWADGTEEGERENG